MVKAPMNSVLLDTAADWVNFMYIALVCLTLTASIIAVFLSYQRTSMRDNEVKKVQGQSALEVASANERSAEANQREVAARAIAAEAESRTAAAAAAQEELRKNNLELSVQLEQE